MDKISNKNWPNEDGASQIPPESIETKIVKKMSASQKMLSEKQSDNNSRWTHQFKSDLECIGEEEGYTVFGYSKKERKFDLSWVQKEDGEHIVLAYESEWSSSEKDRTFDLEKLLNAKYQYRVFVFDADAEFGACWKRMEGHLKFCIQKQFKGRILFIASEGNYGPKLDARTYEFK